MSIYESLKEKFDSIFSSKETKKQQATFKRDNWSNNFTSLGVQSSRSNNTFFRHDAKLSNELLSNLYSNNGIAKRIVETIAYDALKRFINCDEKLNAELKRLNVKQSIFKAATLARLYGGSIMVAMVDDNARDLTKPLKYNLTNKIISFKIFNKSQISWSEEDIETNFYDEYFGEPKYFTINNMRDFNSNNIRIHRSRCHIFNSQKNVDSSCYFGDSILQSCYTSLKNYGIISGSATEIVHDFIQVIIKMNDLMEKYANGEEENVRERLALIDQTRSIQNTIILDNSEEYQKNSSSVAGLSDLWDRAAESICAETGMPITKLFGRSPGGLNATGEADSKNWYDVVSGYREDEIEPCIEWIVNIVGNQKSIAISKSSLSWEFPVLNEPSEKEIVEIKKKYAEIDSVYIDRGAISASDVWDARFGSGKFNPNVNLSSLKDTDQEKNKEKDDQVVELQKK